MNFSHLKIKSICTITSLNLVTKLGLLMRPEFYFCLLFRQVKPFMHSVKKEAIEGGEIREMYKDF